jgi:5-methylcytosine-specific restriction endonuclease McrA
VYSPKRIEKLQEAINLNALAELRDAQATLPPTCHADRRRQWYEVPAVTALFVLRRSGGRCESCRKDKPLEFHHRNYRSLGRELPEDLLWLCRECHHDKHWASGKFILEPEEGT